MTARHAFCDNCDRNVGETFYRIAICTAATQFYVRLCGHCMVMSYMPPPNLNRLAGLARSVANRSGKKKPAGTSAQAGGSTQDR